MCMCGATDCPRCYPGNFIRIDGRLCEIDALTEYLETEISSIRKKDVAGYAIRRGKLFDGGERIQVSDLSNAELIKFAEAM